ncbi:RsmB/NOP family class I SAM-dependent RNA methyltransferase [Paenibacillus taiwanensis]|uniref:RsmB/NOP family class I SAM-dependent RNA methyltransferase n=1 Tax=Paenibacillus taiwanensis TaxID=401638 RepID=UPI0004247D66|nr:RsmB/NOP family class I SAM-dependent RNA methyltransferase [Paenibacillus taiwanensis]
MKALPTAFLGAMSSRLGEEYPSFMDSYHHAPYAGLRVNTLKMEVDQFKKLFPLPIEPIPWTADGFYISEDARPGKHPFYYAGMYYIQEPSAMTPVEYLGVEQGDRVLDLCAAPGGKSVQIAARMGQDGILVTNDIHPDRTKALVRNMELYGVTRAVVLNEQPERIADALPEFFDKVLVDAPCSGEGMFRKDPEMVKAWEREPVLSYAAMQQDILDSAAKLVAPGGRLVYSTCTFSPEENEAAVARFLTKHPDYSVVEVPLSHGMKPGRPEWASDCLREHNWEASSDAVAAVSRTIRLWPHHVKGEGHYVAVLTRGGKRQRQHAAEFSIACPSDEQAPYQCYDLAKDQLTASKQERGGRLRQRGQDHSQNSRKRTGKLNQDPRQTRTASNKKGLYKPDYDQCEPFVRFYKEHFSGTVPELNVCIGSYAYVSPLPIEVLSTLRVVRPGWFVGTYKGERFEPSHAFALGLRVGQARRVYPLTIGHADVVSYLRGDTLTIHENALELKEQTEPKGYVLVTLHDCPIGFGKWVNGILKNEYPAAWRWMS